MAFCILKKNAQQMISSCCQYTQKSNQGEAEISGLRVRFWDNIGDTKNPNQGISRLDTVSAGPQEKPW